MKHLGDGTFGRVVEVKDLITKEYLAMKVYLFFMLQLF